MDAEKKRVKKGFNLYRYYWTLIAFVVLLIVNYYSRNIKVEALDIGLMISIVSFLFGFLVTIVFSMLLKKVSALKSVLAIEVGRLASLFLLSAYLGNKFHEIITEKIDDYTRKTLRNYKNYEVVREDVYDIHRELKLMEVKSDYQRQISTSFLYILGELQPVREQLEYLTSKKVEWPLKLSAYLLGSLLIVLLFLNRGDSFTNAIFVILSTTIIFIFLIIEDYDDLRIGDYSYNISNSEQIFDLLNKERYYPENILSRVNLEKGRKYRIGFYDSSVKEEKIFLITYNPEFNSKINTLISKFK